ncbi:MAG: hypothetical protein ACOYOV_08800 [Bacteroidales bacterium]
MKRLYLLVVAFCSANNANAKLTSLYFGVRPLHANFYETSNNFYPFDFYQINYAPQSFEVRANQSSTISITQHPETYNCKFSFSFTDPFSTDNEGMTQNPILRGGFDVFATPKKAYCLITPPTSLINKQAIYFYTHTNFSYNAQKQHPAAQSQTELSTNNLPFGVKNYKLNSEKVTI